MTDLFDEDGELRRALAGCDPTWLADLERLLNGSHEDMDEAMLTAMMDLRFGRCRSSCIR